MEFVSTITYFSTAFRIYGSSKSSRVVMMVKTYLLFTSKIVVIRSFWLSVMTLNIEFQIQSFERIQFFTCTIIIKLYGSS